MAEKSWLKKIAGLKRLLSAVGPLWPKSTKLAGYGIDGPYYCGMCEYAKRDKDGQLFKDEQGRGRCNQEVVIADSEVEKDSKTKLPIINLEIGCCEFVEKFEEEENGEKAS